MPQGAGRSNHGRTEHGPGDVTRGDRVWQKRKHNRWRNRRRQTDRRRLRRRGDDAVLRGQSGRLWDTLHPADQAVVGRTRYTECQSNAGFDLKKFNVLETYGETVDVAGKATPSTAVSVQTTSDDGVTTATMHAISLNGSWRWILSPAEYRAYSQGKCLSA